MRRGHTLVELSVVLALLALGLSVVLPAARGLRDRSAVLSAREEVAGLIAEARTAALAWGGATVHVRAGDATIWYEAGGRVPRRVSLRPEPGVEVLLPRGRSASDLRYDALGIGRVASETLRFRRGDAESTLVISGYGRVRRW